MAQKSKKPEKILITIKNSTAKKSPHLLNLRNPGQDLFVEKKEPSRIIPDKIDARLPKPPRLALKKAENRVEVNLIQKKSSTAKFLSSKFLDLIKLKHKVLKKTSKDYTEPEDIFASPSHKKIISLKAPHNWHKQIASFTLVSLILILPLQALTYYQSLQNTRDKILLATNEAIENLKAGEQLAKQFELNEADLKFDQAKNSFILAKNEIDALNVLTSEIIKLIPSQKESLNSGVSLLEAGEIIAEIGQILIGSGKDIIGAGSSLAGYYNSLVSLDSNLKVAIEKFRQAENKINSVGIDDLPADRQESFKKILADLPKAENGLKNIQAINSALLKILGHDKWQRYLLIFVNNNELRGGGGFMGSFALLDIDRGEIKKLDIPGGGAYDLQGQLIPKVISPEPLHLINSRWEFQDANWWPDFPTAAKKIEWFYENAGGPSIDGVIMISSQMMENLLAVFGPIAMDEYGREITSDNFEIETQKIVELEYDKEENRPKQFIADLAPKLLDRLWGAEEKELLALFEVLKKNLNEKHLLVYFNNAPVENIVDSFGWSGEIRPTEGDYLSVVHSNVAGGKTDSVIKETINHQAEVQADGSIINTVTLSRRHTGVAGENIFTGVQNNSYVRFYVPVGSELISAEGFKKPPAELFEPPLPEYQTDVDLISIETARQKDEASGTDIYRESGKTVFGNWLQLKPGEIQEATIKYRLPFNLSAEGENTFYYSLLAQKQHGSIGSELNSYLRLKNNLKPLAKFPVDIPSADHEVSFSKTLTSDQFYGVVLISE